MGERIARSQLQHFQPETDSKRRRYVDQHGIGAKVTVMILVPTYVAPSEIEGVGVFAGVAIAKGTLLWRLDPSFDRLIDRRGLETLGPVFREFANRYGYPYPHDDNFLVLELDNGRFMNHSPKPNTCFRDPDNGFALRDISADEELTCDYAEFEPDFEILPGRVFFSVHSPSPWAASMG
jgi:SET domain-containing protein